MVVQIVEKTVLIIGVHEDSPKFRDSAFCRTVEKLVIPHFRADPASA